MVTVPTSGKAAVANVTCPQGRCTIVKKIAEVKIKGKQCKAKVKAPNNIKPGETIKVNVILPKAARKALKKANGIVRLKVTVRSSNGSKVASSKKIKLKAKK